MSDIDIYEDIGIKLRTLRKMNGFTLKEVADRMGTTVMTISRYEKNARKIRLDVLKKILEIYGVDYNDFMTSIKIEEVDDMPILKYYNDLNKRGQDEAVKRVRELTYIPEFKNVQLIAAHERTDIEVTDDMIKRDDELMNEDD